MNQKAARDVIFDVALSFAGEDREIVGAVARGLVDLGYLVFYDRFYESDLIGRDLVSYLRTIYADRSRHCAVFVSRHYVAKRWPNQVERKAILDRSTRGDDPYLIPIVLDSSWLEGLPETTGYLDGREKSPVRLVSVIAKRIGPPPIKADEADLFRQLASDPEVVGRFLTLFQRGSEVDLLRWDKTTPRMRQAAVFGHFLESYELCSCADTLDSEVDRWVGVSLTDRGRRFMAYIERRFFGERDTNGKETNYFI